MLEEQTVSRLVSLSAAPVPGRDGIWPPAPFPSLTRELRMVRSSGWPHVTLGITAGRPD